MCTKDLGHGSEAARRWDFTGAMRRRVTARLGCQLGQSMVLVALFLPVLIGMAGLAVDVGSWYQQKRAAQAVADAAALAAVADLPGNSEQAIQDVSTWGAKNHWNGSLSGTIGTTSSTNDTITVTAQINAPTFLTQVLGITSVAVSAKASAAAGIQNGSYTAWGAGLAPWAITQQDLTFGQTLPLKVGPGNKYAPGNFGAVAYPIVNSSCSTGMGASDYVALIEGTEQSCQINIGDQILTKPGNMGGNTGSALQTRGAIDNFDPMSILAAGPNNSHTLTQPNHPNVVVIPIVDAFPNGRKPITVLDFAVFIITSYSGDTVTGMFVKTTETAGQLCPTPTNPNNPCPTSTTTTSSIGVQSLPRLAS